MNDNKTARSAAFALGIPAAIALTGCGVSEGVKEKTNGHVKAVDYATGTAGKNDQKAQLPKWVPDQARSVSEAIRTTGSERILRFTLDDSKLLTACHPGAASRTPATLTASWWPDRQESKTNRVCDTDWYVLMQGTTVYAYQPETLPQPSS
jgi:hypothetical protein